MAEDDLQLPLRYRLDAYPYALPYAATNDDESLADFYAACDGRTTFEELLAADDRFESAVVRADALVWLGCPIDTPRETIADSAVILAAHATDGFFSLGGYALRHPGADYVVCFARTMHGMRPELAGSELEACAIRRDEVVLSSRISGCTPLFIDLPDFALRAQGEQSSALTEKVRCTLNVMLYRLLAERRPRHVFAPAALGHDPDRRMIFDAMLEFFEQGWFPETTFHLYEDFPESAAPLHVDNFLARFENAYLDVQPWSEDITAVVEQKAELPSAFGSGERAHDVTSIYTVARQAAFAAAPAVRADGVSAMERFWTLRFAFDFNRWTEQSWT